MTAARPSPGPVRISVIIPVWNGEQTIGACLDALFQSSYREFEAIVVDDGSTDSTRAVVERYPCRLVAGQHAGAAAARNIGAKEASGGILLFLDADILVRPDSLVQIEATFERRPKLDALFGSYGKEKVPFNFVSDYKNLLHHYTHQTAQREAATFCGGFGAIRADRFAAIGGFDPRFRFLEDVEMGMRLHAAGMTLSLEPDLRFTHCKRYSLLSLIRSDLYGRAIPWTRLMLSRRIFRNDLNTRTHNVFSVPVSVAIFGGILLLPVVALFGTTVLAALSGALAALAVCLVWLNRGFLAFLAAERGFGFALRAVFLLWLGYLYSLLGLAIGAWQHLASGGEMA